MSPSLRDSRDFCGLASDDFLPLCAFAFRDHKSFFACLEPLSSEQSRPFETCFPSSKRLMSIPTMKIAVLFGGNSSERDVSIASGAQVAKALRQVGHRVIAVDTFRGVLSDVEQQSLVSRGVAPAPPTEQELQAVRAKTGGLVQASYF